MEYDRSSQKAGASPSPSGAARPAAAQAAQAKARPVTAPAPAKAAPPPVRPVAAPPPAAVAGAAPPEHLTITPRPSGDAAGDWEPLAIGSNRSYACAVTTADGSPVSVTITQGMYRRSVDGAGLAKVPAIPPASLGTAGTLVARTSSGASVTYAWQWQPRSQGGRAPGSPAAPAKPAGLLGRLFGRAKAAPPEAKAAVKAAPALTVAERLGTRAAQATQLKFFGQEAVGQRFAFILDRSGSMSGSRWLACTRELDQALRTLPPHAEFFVVLFSQGHMEPPGQSGWAPADRDRIDGVLEWVKKVNPGGGTYPKSAFELVFGLNWAADIIYFLTDGEIEDFTPAACVELRGSAPTLVNTIALENGASAESLRGIADASGGRFIHVPSV
jgi:hypothetical protein